MPKRGENVYHRKDGLWEARYVKEIDANGKRKYGSVYARTCREAKEKRQAVTEHILLYQRPLVASSSWTVSKLAEEWLRLNRHGSSPLPISDTAASARIISVRRSAMCASCTFPRS